VLFIGKAFMPNQIILKSMTEDEVRGIVADFNQNISRSENGSVLFKV